MWLQTVNASPETQSKMPKNVIGSPALPNLLHFSHGDRLQFALISDNATKKKAIRMLKRLKAGPVETKETCCAKLSSVLLACQFVLARTR